MKSLLKNTRLVSLITTASSALIGFASVVVLARILNQNSLGQWMIYLTIWTLVDMLRSGLVQTALIRLYAQTQNSQYTGAAWVLGGAFSIISAFLVYAIGWLTQSSTQLSAYLPVLILVSLPYSVAMWQGQAEQRFDRMMWLRLGVSFPFLGALTMGFWVELTPENIALCQLLFYGIGSLVALWRGWTYWSEVSRSTWRDLTQLWHLGRFGLVTLLGTNLLKSSDTFLLGIFLNPVAVAAYQLPYKLIEVVEIPIRSMVMAILPKWANQVSTSKSLTSLVWKEAAQLMVFVAPISLSCFIFAQPFMVWMGGKNYQFSAQLLQIFAIYSLFLPLDRLIGIALDAHGKPHLNTIKVFMMVSVNVIGDIWVLHFTSFSILVVALISVVTVIVGICVGLWQLRQIDQQQTTSSPIESLSGFCGPNTPLVSIITVNYNQARVTSELLRSLQNITYPNVEVLVVDNNSTKDTTDEIEAEFPTVRFIKSDKNVGFAGGNNLAINQAKGSYLLFINNDVEVAPDFLEPLVLQMQSNKQIGMVSPKIKYFDTPNIIQYAGSSEINPVTGQGHFVGHSQADDGRFDHSGPTAYIHGAAMLVSREVLEQTGTMDDTYFLYYEELDWCARARRDGFTAWYVAESVVWHKESISTGKQSPLKAYYQTRNRLRFMRRNSRLWQQVLGFSFFFIVALPKNLLTLSVAKRWDLVKATRKGAFDFIWAV